MSITRQLYQLQAVDQELEASQQAWQQVTHQLEDNTVVLQARDERLKRQHHLEAVKQQLHSAEWELADIEGKISKLSEELYSGRIKNPKELANLQHELEGLKTRRDEMEDKALETMGQVETADASLTQQGRTLQAVETDWQHQQQQLKQRSDELQAAIADLENQRQQMLAQIDPPAAALYQELKGQKGRAVARVEQGVCQGCRISLSSMELQRAKSGALAQCSSCGRILFQP
ncbi:MAG: C4-type zinc ribbon domain-containing protein [Chloroflexota bacterium]